MKSTSILDLLIDQQDEAFATAVRHHENKEYDQAWKAFEQLAQRNDPQAQLNLALMIRDGQGVTADPITAHMWLELAARSGDAVAVMERDHLQRSLNPQQLAQAAQRINAWPSIAK